METPSIEPTFYHVAPQGGELIHGELVYFVLAALYHVGEPPCWYPVGLRHRPALLLPD